MDRAGYNVKRGLNPKEAANAFSQLCFAYMLPTFIKGKRKDLEEDDLQQVMSTLTSKPLGDQLERYWEKEKAAHKHPSVKRLLINCYGGTYSFLGIMQLIAKLIVLIVSPKALATFVSYFTPNQTDVSKEEACIYAGVIISIYFLQGVYEQHYILMKSELGIEIQQALSSLLYRKALALSTEKLNDDISAGKIITTITKDLAALVQAVHFAIEFLLEIITTFVTWYLLYSHVGVASVGGFILAMLTLPIQALIGKIVFNKRSICNKAADERLQMTQEVLTHINVIKQYTWEPFFEKRLLDKRKKELDKLKYIFLWKSFSSTIGMFINTISFALLFMTHIWLGNVITSELVYYVTSLFQSMKKSAIFIPMGINACAELLASLRRIDAILNAEEVERHIRHLSKPITIPRIEFVNAVVSAGETIILNQINLKLKPGLNILIGAMGSGKSSLMKAILEDYSVSNGKLYIEGTVSYASENPWLFPSSLKQNILFGQPYNAKKYQKVLNMCALTFDVDTFSRGDDIILSDCGVNLSKGQRARVNLARALYKDSDIYLLDECLSALDTHIKNYVFKNGIKTYLKNKLCLLATNNTQYVNDADNVIIMLDRTLVYVGKPSDIPENIFKKVESVDPAVETPECNLDVDGEKDIENDILDEGKELLQHICTSKKANIYHEVKKSGKVGWNVYIDYFRFGGGFLLFSIIIGFHIFVAATFGFSDKMLSRWVDVEENITAINHANHTQNNTYITMADTTSNLSFIFHTTITPMQNVTDSPTSNMEKLIKQKNLYKLLFFVAAIVSCIIVLLRAIAYYIFTFKISKNIFKSMVRNVLGATMVFFDTHMIGNILNRFSKDLFVLDEFLPIIMNEALRMAFLLLAIVGVMASVNYILAIYAVVVGFVFLFICKYSLHTMRSFKRLDSAIRSPVIGHLNATLEGLTTIRAYGNQSILRDEFDKHQDLFASAAHLSELASRTIGFYMHIVSSILMSVVVLRFLRTDNLETAGNVGIVITQTTGLALFLEWALTSWMMVENNMTNVERLCEYTDIKQENNTGQVLNEWPKKGGVEFRNINLRYRNDSEQVLKNLSFAIKPKEKIGIVGRTGAGKSSITAALFRLYEVEGDILIDGVNIKTLSLEFLRSKISIVPQDPIIFTGTIRSNIDPMGNYTDDAIWKALDVVNLSPLIKNLDETIDHSGINFSVGQRQLLCLARAIVRKNKIFILDEATANMDKEMDQLIHEKIDVLLKYSTVIIVAHKLNSIMNCDRVIVMEKGNIVELGNPRQLLNNVDGTFYKMVNND